MPPPRPPPNTSVGDRPARPDPDTSQTWMRRAPAGVSRRRACPGGPPRGWPTVAVVQVGNAEPCARGWGRQAARRGADGPVGTFRCKETTLPRHRRRCDARTRQRATLRVGARVQPFVTRASDPADGQPDCPRWSPSVGYTRDRPLLDHSHQITPAPTFPCSAAAARAPGVGDTVVKPPALPVLPVGAPGSPPLGGCAASCSRVRW